MDKNLLKNMHKLLIVIRFEISDVENVKYVKFMINAILEEQKNSEFIQYISAINPNLIDRLISENGENVSVFQGRKDYFIHMLHELNRQIEDKNFDVAYDIADMLHTFPEMIFLDKKAIKSYYKIYVKPVVKKWNIFQIKDIKKDLLQY